MTRGAVITRSTAYAAGQDAGNRSAEAGGRGSTWNADDWNAAAGVTRKLLGMIESAVPRAKSKGEER